LKTKVKKRLFVSASLSKFSTVLDLVVYSEFLIIQVLQ